VLESVSNFIDKDGNRYAPEHPGDHEDPRNAEAVTLMRGADLVRQAIAQGYSVRQCRACRGPLALSKTRPIGQCLRCQAVEATTAPAAKTRRLCKQCRRFFSARWPALRCPNCIAREQRSIAKGVGPGTAKTAKTA
jgi:Zn finger protein HypA/HybF involved in hydrogenase expression